MSVLRRLSTNLVDLITTDGEYCRVLDEIGAGDGTQLVAHVRQTGADVLVVRLASDQEIQPAESAAALALLRRTLGVDQDLTHFDHAASGIAWLAPVASRMRGVRPPRYQTLWEACVNAVVFQQVSLLAASAIMGRMITALTHPRESCGVRLHPFPTIGQFLSAPHADMRAAGLSESKLSTLTRVAEEVSAGTLGVQALEELSSADASERLREIKGIGPWTAALVLLRGLGRLDVFPVNDTSVARNLAIVSGATGVDVGGTVEKLAPQQGMLYYHLLLARLESRGTLGQPSRASVVPGDAL